MPMPDLEGWAIFATVAERRSFTAAAEALGLSKATVSKAVSRLEARVGAQLFHRTSRRLSLTPAGQSLAGRAARLLSDAQAAEEAAREEATGPSGIVRMAAPMGFGILYVAPALVDLHATCPNLTVDLHLSDARIDLVEQGFDLALRIGHLADSSLRARRLADIPRYLIASPGYLARAGRPAHPAEIERHACLTYSNSAQPDRWRFVDRAGVEVVVRARGPLSANSGESMLPMLRAGAGMAWLPGFMVEEDLAAGRLEVLLPEWTQPPEIGLHLVTPPGGPRPARVTAAIDFFAKRFGGRAGLARP